MDWNSLMQSMSSWLSGSGQANAIRDQAAATRRAAIRQLAIKYGGLPQGFTDQYGDIDSETQRLMGENQYSDIKQLTKRFGESREQMLRQLAARRALGSGETQFGLDKLDYQRGSDEYNLGNQFFGGVNQALAGYGDRLQQAYAIEAEAAQQARMMALALMSQQASLPGGGGGYTSGPQSYGSEFPLTETGIPGLIIKEPFDYVKNSDIRYLTPNWGGPSAGWSDAGGGTWIGPDGRRYDESGRVM